MFVSKMDAFPCLLCLLFIAGNGESQEVTGEDNLQGYMYHSFQTVVGAFKRECFYQYLPENTSVSLIWHVMSAGGTADLATVVTFNRHSPVAEHLHMSPYGQMGDFRIENLDSGTYEMCIDNELGYTSKLVYLWFDYQTVRELDYRADEEEPEKEQSQLQRDFIRNIIRTLESRTHDMNYYQAIYRERNTYHELSLHRLQRIIDNRSFLAFVLVIATAVLQVMFVRKLFQADKQTTKSGI